LSGYGDTSSLYNGGSNYLNFLNMAGSMDNNSLLALTNPAAANALYSDPNNPLNPGASSSIYNYYGQSDPTSTTSTSDY